MTTSDLRSTRSSTFVRPAVHSAAAMKRLEESLRRLGADEDLVAIVTGRRPRRRVRMLPN